MFKTLVTAGEGDGLIIYNQTYAINIYSFLMRHGIIFSSMIDYIWSHI